MRKYYFYVLLWLHINEHCHLIGIKLLKFEIMKFLYPEAREALSSFPVAKGSFFLFASFLSCDYSEPKYLLFFLPVFWNILPYFICSVGRHWWKQYHVDFLPPDHVNDWIIFASIFLFHAMSFSMEISLYISLSNQGISWSHIWAVTKAQM